MDRIADTVRFYGLLCNLAACLGGCRRLADCNGRMELAAARRVLLLRALLPATAILPPWNHL